MLVWETAKSIVFIAARSPLQPQPDLFLVFNNGNKGELGAEIRSPAAGGTGAAHGLQIELLFRFDCNE